MALISCVCGSRYQDGRGNGECSNCRRRAGLYDHKKMSPRVLCSICGTHRTLHPSGRCFNCPQHDCVDCGIPVYRTQSRCYTCRQNIPRALVSGLVEYGIHLSAIAELFGVSRQRIEQLLHMGRRRARSIVRNSLRSGRVLKPTTCERCETATRDLEAHHDDYAQPLDVTWLCVPCHNIVHPHGRKAARALILVQEGEA